MKVTVLFPALHDHSQKLRFTRIIALQPKSTTRVEQELDDQSSKKIERPVEVGKRKISTFEEVDGSKKKLTMKKRPTAAQRMVWEEERGGWVKGKEKQVRVVKEEEYGGMWTSYGCYVMVESFVLRRNDGSLVLTYDFRHTHQLRGNWE